jgi:error-prone DNA polymerase
MKDIEKKLRAGMEKTGIGGKTQDKIVRAITSFALYGFPESHAASFALLAYASAYLKCHYLAAFTAALLNNQPMGFYQPATIVKDAQRHGLKIRPIDVTCSDWLCTLEKYQQGFALRLGLRYVKGLRQEMGLKIAEERTVRKFSSVDDLKVRIPAMQKSELAGLAEIGALNLLTAKESGMHRRDALWQVERAARPAGALFEGLPEFLSDAETLAAAPSGLRMTTELSDKDPLTPAPLPQGGEGGVESNFCPLPLGGEGGSQPATSSAGARRVRGSIRRPVQNSAETHPSTPMYAPPASSEAQHSPLAAMNSEERLVADFRGTGMTIGPHPMAYKRAEMKRAKVRSVAELAHLRNGMKVRVAGAVIARQRPGTANGFVFLSLEDETGITNAIITPQLFKEDYATLVQQQFLLIEGKLQNQEGVVSVKAERVQPLRITQAETASHDFH